MSACTKSCDCHMTSTYHRGLLTGKYKRGESAVGVGRMGWVEKEKSRVDPGAYADLSQYTDNEQYWELIETMKTIAAAHSEFCLGF